MSPLFPLIFCLSPSLTLSLSLRSARLLVPTMCLCFFLLFEHEKSASSTSNRTPPVARSTSFVAWTLVNKVHEARPLADHGYWFTMPRIIRHYPMWYMGSRGHRFSREPAACYVFPLSSTASFLIRVLCLFHVVFAWLAGSKLRDDRLSNAPITNRADHHRTYLHI